MDWGLGHDKIVSLLYTFLGHPGFKVSIRTVMSEYHKMDTNKYLNIFEYHIMYRMNIQIYSDATIYQTNIQIYSYSGNSTNTNTNFIRGSFYSNI